jgi:hypothetical protein
MKLKCIAILAQLNSDTDQILISQRTTNGFNKSGWNVFRPDRDEFSKRKRWEISCQTQKEKQDRTKGNRIRSAREALFL